MKRTLALFLSVLMALSMAACAPAQPQAPQADAEPTAAPAAEPTAAPVTEPAPEAAKMTPGVYTVTTAGCYDDYTIEVEVDETSIVDVRIVDTHESQYMGQRAQETIAANVVAHQSVNVDSITGATVTTVTMKYAIRDALTQAGAAEDMFSADCTTPAPIHIKGDIADFEPDVIVVGAGITGLTAALTAADTGAKVLILEQMPHFGGSTLYSGGYIAAAGGDTLTELGYVTDADKFASWLQTGDPATFRAELATIAGVNSGKALDILTKYGATWDLGGPIGETVGAHGNAASAGNTTEGVDYFAAYLISTSGRGLGIFEDTAASVQEFVEAGQMAYLLNTKATELITDASGAVTGVRVESGEEYYAPATILASGGYCNNDEMLAKQYTRYAQSGSDAAIGNMFDAALDVGAVLHDMDFCRTDGGVLPTRDGNGWQVEREVNYKTAGLVWLNTSGVRFMKEEGGGAKGYYNTDQNTVYIVANQALADSASLLYYGNYATFVADENNELLNELAAEGKVVFKGDTIEEAAEKAGLDPAVVAAEMVKYNQFCANGVDEDFGKAATRLIAMEEGPFYIFETIPNVKNTYGGLVIDDGARVLRADGSIIPGLYAAGETAGNYNIASPSVSYYGGNLHRGATFGYTAALTAVADIA